MRATVIATLLLVVLFIVGLSVQTTDYQNQDAVNYEYEDMTDFDQEPTVLDQADEEMGMETLTIDDEMAMMTADSFQPSDGDQIQDDSEEEGTLFLKKFARKVISIAKPKSAPAPKPAPTPTPVAVAGFNRNLVPNALKRFQPIFLFHKGCKYFPFRIEDITRFEGFTDEQLRGGQTVTYSTKYYPKNNAAPVYVNVRHGNGIPAGRVWINYVIAQTFNDCGPKVRVSFKVFGKSASTGISVCPGGVHWGDFEHVTVETDAATMTQFHRIYISYHAFGKWFAPNQVSREGNHAKIYVSLGSHALYPKPGVNEYMKLWDKTALGTGTTGYLADYAAPSESQAIRWTGVPRWIAENGKPIAGISETERRFAIFTGRFGAKIVNNRWMAFKENVLKFTSPVRKVSSSLDREIRNGLNKADSEMQSYASSGLGGKGWFGGNKPDSP